MIYPDYEFRHNRDILLQFFIISLQSNFHVI
nr:MAG TPA: hypothetical protein [Inoviridae sp.]